MKGRNTIELNEATMMAALQHYFDTLVYREGESPLVLSIKPSKDHAVTGNFSVAVDEKDVRNDREI